MQGVLATATLPGCPHRVVMRDDLHPNTFGPVTLVQEADVTGVWYQYRWGVTRRG